jgi:hypothetical protein
LFLEDARDIVGGDGDLDDAHAAAAALERTDGDLDGEDASQEPGPRVARGRGRLERCVTRLEERQLRRRALRLAAGDDLGAHGGVGGEHAVIADHVESRRRDEGGEPGDEVEGVEQDGVGAVLPGRLEREPDAAVVVEREALLGERRPGEVAAQALEARAVTAVATFACTLTPLTRALRNASRPPAFPGGVYDLTANLARYDAVTASGVREAARRWLPRDERLVVSIAGRHEAPAEGRIVSDVLVREATP